MTKRSYTAERDRIDNAKPPCVLTYPNPHAADARNLRMALSQYCSRNSLTYTTLIDAHNTLYLTLFP